MSDRLAACSPPPKLVLERPRYYQGQMLTAGDFTAEQEYHLNRRYLINRLLYGWGVVCGLAVGRHAESGDDSSAVAVSAGVALDGCGREIISAADLILDCADLLGRWGLRQGDEHRAENEEPLLLCARYCEEKAAFAPATWDPNGGGEMEAGRIREKADFLPRRLDEMDPETWERGERPCLANDSCPGAGLVPLAGLYLEKRGSSVVLLRIDLSYRRPLAGGRLSTSAAPR